jgi:hypothetical protein
LTELTKLKEFKNRICLPLTEFPSYPILDVDQLSFHLYQDREFLN